MAKKARTVTLNLDGKHPNYKIQANTWRMDFDSYGREDVDRSWELSFDSGPLDWDQLVQLRELYVLDYKGQDATILQYLASPKSTISEFTWWDHGQ
ncbi:MAG: hypothetical protein KDB22_20165, partial [Planctomycetales bacterium]|nr:hypothetical protein [Planctomycetales bacterium]